MTTIDEIVENFTLLDEWDDRYRYVIELGRTLAPLAESAHTEANKVQGCASQVWLLTHVKPDGAAGPVLRFEGDSDAHIVRGLVAILFALYSGKRRRRSWPPMPRAVRPHRPAREPHAATLERLALDGRAHPRRSECGAWRLWPKPYFPSTMKPAPSASQTRTGAWSRPLASAA